MTFDDLLDRFYFYDCEIFAHDSLFVFISYRTKERFVFHNAKPNDFQEFIDKNKPILVGYNNNGYDKYMLKFSLLGYTPEELKDICTLYAHDWYLIDIVVYQGEPYAVHMENLPVSTSLAYYNNGEKEALYYSRDIGGRRNILQIGAFDFKTKKDVAVDIDYNELEKHHDYLGVAFESLTDSETGKKMLAARRIIWNDDDVMAIDYDSYLYEDLTIYPFVDWEKFEAK